MSLRILLTSDLHLGMKFASLPERQKELAEARFTCLERLVALANERRCDLFVVAGDLFERISIPKREAERAAAALRDFQGRLAVVLPGNHDFLSPGDELWRHFRDTSGDAVLLLEEGRPYPLSHYGLDVSLYPGPCVSKHSKTNAIGWVRSASGEQAGYRIGIAHGSLEGFSPDFKGDYYPMKSAELLEAGLDVWLLGHTHLRYPQKPAESDRIFNAGTPEPDGFDCGHEGSAWLLERGEDGKLTSEPLETGAYRFMCERVEVRNASDLAAFEARYSTPPARKMLLKAVLGGRLSTDVFPELERARGRMAERLFHLQWDSSGVREAISRETIEREYPAGSFPHRLLTELSESGDGEAIEMAFELLQEARG